MNKTEGMERLRDDLKNCSRCDLCKYSTNHVIGEGNLNSKTVFIGEAPGKDEDIKGKPFVGSAGKILNKMLEKTGISRKRIYITNLVKCRPPNNRKPLKNELNACSTHIERELEIIKPKIIAPMGNTAIRNILRKYGLKPLKIGEIHGKIFREKAKWGEILIMPLYHPAASLYNNNLLALIEEDLRQLELCVSKS
jgi:DNA polymerase